MRDESDDMERAIREAYASGDARAVAERTLALYGREIASFIVARLRSEDHGREVYAIFAEDLWASLGSFGCRRYSSKNQSRSRPESASAIVRKSSVVTSLS